MERVPANVVKFFSAVEWMELCLALSRRSNYTLDDWMTVLLMLLLLFYPPPASCEDKSIESA